ncbi:hypothetical protein K458DRAFT_286657 [Lentithecium fluviatile CBS 122367]|uniref:Methyltransferase type 11 domain-containing protein n=1 Tax=Lentithecium fluviatile CBS 122367 TaxID=1168545 RepID=A0A6G1JNS8_9PLEO|nr:hypothetical protein K458DRAFT_286657 [Lentithecium fluviatile CBS 122367]
MASYKSQFNPPRRVEDQTPYPHRTTTRLPQRSVTPTAAAPLPAAKLQKKQPARDEQVYPSRRVPGQRALAPKPSVVVRPRQGSTTPTVPITHASPSLSATKSTSQTSSSRLPKLEVPESTRTPSLVSGSSASTIDSPRSNVLRKKQSSIGAGSGGRSSRTRDASMSSQEEKDAAKGIPGGYKDPFSETVLGISLPPSSTILARSDPELELPFNPSYDFDVGPTDMLPPPAPLYALSTTPSTRYSESPGPFSISSTPTSMSSYSHSPAASLPSKASFRMRQASPLQGRPPFTRHRTPDEHGLPSVRESSTSSSSTSTILVEGERQKAKQLSDRLPAPPPSPPPKDFIRRPSKSAEEKPRVQAPPEFAHLADQAPTMQGPRRPTRPSRDGTSEIVGLRGPSPIIQSNMSSFPSPHKRTPSAGSTVGIAVAGKTRFGIPSKPSSRNPSPSPTLASGFAPVSRVPTRGPTPELHNNSEGQRSQTLPAPAPAPSPGKTSRFGFFTRRTKTEPTLSAAKQEKKLHRRGPAAGTGHEGYGRYAVRGRSGSTASTTSVGRSASAATTTDSLDRTPSTRKSSVTSTTSSDVDDYFLDRLAPVVIRGTGSSTELTRSPEPMQSSSSLDVSIRSGMAPNKTTKSSLRPALENGHPSLLPSAMSDQVRGMSPGKKMPLGFRRPSESDDDSKRSFIPSLTSRRASRTSKFVDVAPASKVSRGGASATKVRKDSLGDITSDGKEGSWLKSSKKGKIEKETSKPPRKWNFFQRAHAVPRVATPAVEPSTASPARAPPSRSVAHYAPMGSQSGLGLEDIEKIMQEADSSPEDLSPPEEGVKSALPDNEPRKNERLHSMLLPPKPILSSDLLPPARPASPKVFLRPELQPQPLQTKLAVDTTTYEDSTPPPPQIQAELTPVTDLSPCSSPTRPQSLVSPVVSPKSSVPVSEALQNFTPASGPPPTNPPPRPSRLAQVGRIPQVVSRRNQVHRPPSVSFSRPFATYQSRPSLPSRTSTDSDGPLTVSAGAVEPYPVLHGLNALAHGSAIATMSPSAEESARRSEFFNFPPRKDSEVSYSSSSGIWSFPPTAGTAVMPPSGAPQSEDEVWNEYDDLIDEVLSPVDSNTSGHKEKVPRKHPSMEPLPLRTKASRASSQSAGSRTGVAVPSLHLRRSRLLAVLHSQSPTSPVSLSDFLQEYGEKSISVVDPVTGRLSFPSSVRISAGSGPKNRPASSRSSLPVSLTLSARQSKATLASASDKDRESASAKKYRDSKLMEIAETQADGLVSMANLRFGALMTSKWLSFGRVLFSPAHFELSNPNEDRVLVIDGLGKDWSYYCALTYPEATIYDLGPGASSATLTSSGPEPWSTLSNHRHISHPSLSTAFPFPKGFFACVVLRFPPALPTSVHRFVLSECKRVLRPGGHLELSVLDLDLVNMGNRARRAVRGLKVKMQVADENVSLRNVSDEIMGLLGRKGFTECNRCFVGVPVAGTLPNPDDQETSAGKKRKGSSASSITRPGGAATGSKKPKPEVSFSDLLNKHASSDSTDTTITDMVARVGRWWYSRCYESLVLPEAGEEGAANSGKLLESSIWRDESLISECEKRGTSFRLLIGYAQKPEVGVRRTVSV